MLSVPWEFGLCFLRLIASTYVRAITDERIAVPRHLEPEPPPCCGVCNVLVKGMQINKLFCWRAAHWEVEALCFCSEMHRADGICFVEACRIPLQGLKLGLTVEVASVLKILPPSMINLTARSIYAQYCPY